MNIRFKNVLMRISISLVTLTTLLAWPAGAQDTAKPNVVLVFMDNFGYGELGVYGGGITRGGPTPRIDTLATEGMRLTNFNVEAQCTPSRAAIMTGRYAVRTGNSSVPLDTPLYGLTQWEYAMAEMFSDAGYRTGMFGKWHLGQTEGRFPTDQGFDEWYGIPNSSDESLWPEGDYFLEGTHPAAIPEHVYDGRKGQQPDNGQDLRLGRPSRDRRRDYREGQGFHATLACRWETVLCIPALHADAWPGKAECQVQGGHRERTLG